jgi:acetolactate synthase-1/2/3 large subunit
MARATGRTVGRLIADALAAAGVRWAFTVPGESFLEVLDALPAAGIRVIATRHEGGAAFMAEAVGQLTGAPAAVLGTRAVGAANMSIGIHTARSNSTPLVALVGQVARSHLGREAFQESDLVATFGRLAKWAAQLDDPAKVAARLAEGLSAMR